MAADPGTPDVVELTRQLVEIPSVTGQEKAVGEFLYGLLRDQGWDCTRQAVQSDRFNLLAVRERPAILLTTHIDTVPPFFPSSEDDEFVYGRGSCDAKGIAASMICAAAGLTGEAGQAVGLLFVVGEETDSVGARTACRLDLDCRFIVDGEPTDNQLAVGHKGILHARLQAKGVASHSACPEEGESAIEKLMDLLTALRGSEFPSDPVLGETCLNVGTIAGGRAANVIADRAEAEILIRTVTASEVYLERLNRIVDGRAELEVLKTSEPQEMEIVEGFPTKIVGYGTDIPVLRALGKPLLFGPGSILQAHSATERVAKRELAEAVDLYRKLVRRLMAG